jgi:glucose-specific phosphotransferase system IIA component
MLFSKKQKIMMAVANGKAIPLSEVPDEAFSSGILGVGFAIEPEDGTVYSPVSGKIDSITDSRHAYTILSDDGLDVLVHIGIDTVELGGNGFLSMVSIGDTVKEGDVIARADLDVIRKAEKPTVIPVLVTNPDALGSHDFTYGKVLGGKSEVMRYRLS